MICWHANHAWLHHSSFNIHFTLPPVTPEPSWLASGYSDKAYLLTCAVNRQPNDPIEIMSEITTISYLKDRGAVVCCYWPTPGAAPGGVGGGGGRGGGLYTGSQNEALRSFFIPLPWTIPSRYSPLHVFPVDIFISTMIMKCRLKLSF